MVSNATPNRTPGLRTPAVDHVLLATPDLEVASHALSDRYGLISVEGGQHPGWGTANRIVPVGDAYLELIAVVDERVAERSAFGRWVAGAHAPICGPIGWAVRPRSLDEVAERLGLAVDDGARTTPSGEVLTWRLAGVDCAVAEPLLPFFIEWGVNTRHPSRADAEDSNDAVEIIRLELTGDADRLRAWLDDDACPVVLDPGPSGVRKVVLSTPSGEVCIDASIGEAPHSAAT